MTANLLLALAGLLLLSALFSLFETAFFSLSRARLKQIMQGRPRGEVDSLARLLARPQEILTLVVLGVTLVNITLAVVATVLLHSLLGHLVDRLVGHANAEIVFLLLESLGVTFLLLVFGEISPKLFALAHAERTALALAPSMTLVARLLGGPARLLARALRLDRVLDAHGRGADLITVEELKTIVEAGSREGTLEEEEKQLLQGAIRIGELTAAEVMVKREDMVAVPDDADAAEVIQTVRETWHSRIPVFRDTLDNVVGVVAAKDVLPYLDLESARVQVREVMRPATFVPSSLPIDDVLRLLQNQRTQLAVVADSSGHAVGVCSLEDVLEELVGKLDIEYTGDTPAVEVHEDGTAVLQARVHVRDANRLLDLRLPLDRGRTVGDLVRSLVPGPPVEGESVRVAGVELVLETVLGGHVRALRVVRDEP